MRTPLPHTPAQSPRHRTRPPPHRNPTIHNSTAPPVVVGQDDEINCKVGLHGALDDGIGVALADQCLRHVPREVGASLGSRYRIEILDRVLVINGSALHHIGGTHQVPTADLEQRRFPEAPSVVIRSEVVRVYQLV